jgi:hypothetical protein
MPSTTVTAQNVRLRFPEFGTQTDAAIEFAIEDALRVGDAATLGLDYTRFIMYMAGHILMVGISRAESASGLQIASESMDGIGDITYQTNRQPTMADLNDWTTTPYGTMCLDIVKRQIPAVMVI